MLFSGKGKPLLCLIRLNLSSSTAATRIPSFIKAAAGFSPNIGVIPSMYVILIHSPKG